MVRPDELLVRYSRNNTSAITTVAGRVSDWRHSNMMSCRTWRANFDEAFEKPFPITNRIDVDGIWTQRNGQREHRVAFKLRLVSMSLTARFRVT